MHPYTILPNSGIKAGNIISDTILSLGIRSFLEACRYVHQLPYGYKSDRDDLMILFKEKMGTCSTKHAVIASLAAELGLPRARGAELKGVDIKRILHAREEGLKLLKTNIRLP